MDIFNATEQAMMKALIEQTVVTMSQELKKGIEKGRHSWHLASIEHLQKLYHDASDRGDLPSAITLLAMCNFRMQWEAGYQAKEMRVSV